VKVKGKKEKGEIKKRMKEEKMKKKI